MYEIGETLNSVMIRDEVEGGVRSIVRDISIACKAISNMVNQGDLAGVLGLAGGQNAMGDDQKKMDLIANDMFIDVLRRGGHIAGMASEEVDDILPIAEGESRGDYLVAFDPLDGSSNIDINMAVGAIFSILRSPEGKLHVEAKDFSKPGYEQLAAGYCKYGPASMLVLTTGDGVNGYTYNQAIGEFIMTHPDMKIPEDTAEYAINASNQRFWDAPVQEYIADCLLGEEGPLGKRYNMRWVAAMVSDVHRILCRGGVFMYPIDERNREAGGKLRLLYEGNPMAMIIEQAGGLATTGYERILDIQPNGDPHERVPVIMGSKNEVEKILSYHQK